MVVPNGTVVPWSLQLCKFGACVRSSSVRRNHSRCDDLHSNPPCPLGTTKLPMPPAISTGHTVRFDSHMRTNSQGVTMAQVAQRGNSWRVVRRGKPRVKHSATCSMHLRTDRSRHVHTSVHSARRARRSSGCHGQGAAPPCCVLLLCCDVDAPGQKRIPHLFCATGLGCSL